MKRDSRTKLAPVRSGQTGRHDSPLGRGDTKFPLVLPSNIGRGPAGVKGRAGPSSDGNPFAATDRVKPRLVVPDNLCVLGKPPGRRRRRGTSDRGVGEVGVPGLIRAGPRGRPLSEARNRLIPGQLSGPLDSPDFCPPASGVFPSKTGTQTHEFPASARWFGRRPGPTLRT